MVVSHYQITIPYDTGYEYCCNITQEIYCITVVVNLDRCAYLITNYNPRHYNT